MRDEKEQERIEALRSYSILDTAPELAFDELVERVSKICEVPIALLSLVDCERQWFKSKFGLETSETPREYAFCNHAIQGTEIFVVEDTHSDERFVNNPLVRETPYIRFYAGAPLITAEGHALGTLCVIDQNPRKLTDNQEKSLRLLAQEAMIQIELRRKVGLLNEANHHLREKEKKATEATNAKSRFLANMSHEIRTPMNGVMGVLELLGQTTLDEEQAELVKIARESAASLLGVVNDVLDFSRIEAGVLVLSETLEDPRRIIESVSGTFATQLYNKKLSLQPRIGKDVPKLVRTDWGKVRQIIINLLANAIKFTPERGHISLEFDTSSEMNHRATIKFSIADSGIGIPKEFQSTIFDAFSQADNSLTRQYGGTGLGLTITARLVELLGGSITVQSDTGKGSKFSVEVPITVGPLTGLPENSKKVDPRDIQERFQHGKKLKILLCEDNLVNQRVAKGILDKCGFETRIVENGAAAVEAYASERFDVILMDIQTPIMDGEEATRQIRKIEQATFDSIPIIALTAHAFAAERDRFLSVGMNHYLAKPFSQIELLEILELVLSEASGTQLN